MTSIVVHYQEIALKGKNRPWFLGRLVRNLKRALSDLDVIAVRALMGRIEIQLGPGATREAAGERVRRTFGIANYSYARRTALDIDVITAAILTDLRDRTCSSFRVSVRRADKRFPMTSPQVEREVGGRIKEARGWKVDREGARAGPAPDDVAAAVAVVSRGVRRHPAAGGARGAGPDACDRLPPADAAHRGEDRARARRAGACHRRRRRAGGVADAREPAGDRERRDPARLPPADRHGQARDHGRGAPARQPHDLDHPRSRLLHAVHAAQPADARTSPPGGSSRACVADRRNRREGVRRGGGGRL